jgi:adenylate cyclase, class 2
MSIEVEQKFAVDDHREIQRRLEQLGASEVGIVEQVDRYFNHPARDFAQTDEALRLRRVGETNFITYKGPKLDAATKTRREIELPLGNGANTAAGFAEILAALGFRISGEVHKTRRILHVNWQRNTVEVALDNVANLGSFVELEISVDEHQVEPAKSAIVSLAEELKLSQNERRSYLELLLAKR